MRIGIDARFWGPQQGGIGRYVERLVAHLADMDSSHEFVFFVRKEVVAAWPFKKQNWHIVPVDVQWYTFREQFVMPIHFYRARLDLLHVPHYNLPLLYLKKTVVTIHDFIVDDFPTARASTLYPIWLWIKKKAYRLTIWKAIRQSVSVITITEFSRKKIITNFPWAAKKIFITYEAVDPLLGDADWQTVSQRGLQSPYLLYAGNTYPHKNLERFLQAAHMVYQAGEKFQVVLVGKRDYFSRRLEAMTTAIDMKNVLYFGYATDGELRLLYEHAQAYFFPSLSEGFGLPGLEAMQSGVPVYAANNSCLPEVYGPAASYFDPLSDAEIQASIKRSLHDILERQRLIEAGKKRLDDFSWQRMAEQTMAVYTQADDHGKTSSPAKHS